ncbi:MAG: HD-GYP domain-containing protein [Syntrophomonadaceae bacterium]|nr:HD-GYP domain-containing protein [Syntrophomonadaceae bacterium]MDD3899193.1 HD-GYP domain-containing protein [Syntrophomonadaceae bacterium]
MVSIDNMPDVLGIAILGMCFCLLTISLFRWVTNYYLISNIREYLLFIFLVIAIALWSARPLLDSFPVNLLAWKWISLLAMALFLSLYFLTLRHNIEESYSFRIPLMVIVITILLCLFGLQQSNWQEQWWIIIITIIAVAAILAFNISLIIHLAKTEQSNFYKYIAILLAGFTVLISVDNISSIVPQINIMAICLTGGLLFVVSLGVYVMDQAYMNATRELEQRFQLVQDKYEATVENIEDVVISLARTIDAKDRYTEGHTERVSQYAAFLGERLGMTDKQLENLRIGALIHDIGKIGIDQNVLNKPGKLTLEERQQIETHPILGEEICSPLKSLQDVTCIIRNHHERLDGSGYPDGLQGDEIPLEARIVSIVDVFDALTTDRSYRPAMSIEAALTIIRQEANEGKLDASLAREFEIMLQDMFLLVEET